jgi:anaerobic dimethyl sulfoxide reductase subunit B (iron-sulfur subunit)
MTACFDRNDLEVPQKFRVVYEFGDASWQQGEDGSYSTNAFAYYASMTCCHCQSPACVANCPTGAMQKDAETGIVDNDKTVCIGCMTCANSCPYHHPVQLADSLSHKCTLCNNETSDGSPDPVCAKSCPMRALTFGLMSDLRAEHGNADKIGELGNTTSPDVVIGPHRDASSGGVLLNPDEVGHEK